MSTEEKQDTTSQYRKTPQEFNLLISDPKAGPLDGGLVEKFRVVMFLTEKIYACPKGSHIRVFDGQEYRTLTKRHARSMKSKFEKDLKDLKKVFKHSLKKKPGANGKKDVMNAPMYAGSALLEFLSKGDFGPVNVKEWKAGAKPDSLMSHLNLASQGYLTRNTLTQLFYVYIWMHNLQEEENGQYLHYDKHMTKCFSQLPATFYRKESAKGGKVAEKVLMDEAIKDGLCDHPLTTTEAIRVTHPNFYTDKTPIVAVPKKLNEENAIEYGKRFQVNKVSFANSFLQVISSHNVYQLNFMKENPEMLAAQYEFITQEDTIEALAAERELVGTVADAWRTYRAEHKNVAHDEVKKAKAQFMKDLNKKAVVV